MKKNTKLLSIFLFTVTIVYISTGIVISAPFWRVLFSRGDNTFETTNNLEEYLARVVDTASDSVAVMTFTLGSGNNQLVNGSGSDDYGMNKRAAMGADVRFVMDGSSSDPGTLSSSVYKANDGSASGQQHNKILIVDEKVLMTGSINFTSGGYSSQPNNALFIYDQNIIKEYLKEFNEQWGGTKGAAGTTNFHAGSPGTNQFTTSNGTLVEVYFNPDDSFSYPKLDETLGSLISNSTESVFYMINRFTDQTVANAILNNGGTFKEGVVQEGAFSYHSDPTIVSNLQNNHTARNSSAAGSIFVSGGSEEEMHHKVIIIDQDIVATGSANHTYKAMGNTSSTTSNDENIIIVHDGRLARRYMQEYRRIMGLVPQENTGQADSFETTGPNPVTNLSVSPAGSNMLSITWTAPSDPGDFSRYYIFAETFAISSYQDLGDGICNDGDNLIDEDPVGDIDGFNGNDDDADGSSDEDPWLAPEQILKTSTPSSVTSTTLTTINQGDSLPNNVDVWIAVVGVDKHGNESTPAFFGPVQAKDNIDHFEVSAASPSVAGAVFSLFMTAADTTGAVITAFNSSVSMSVDGGTITPTTSGNFSNGILTQSVSLTESGTRTINVTNGTVSGSTTITINPATTADFVIYAPAAVTKGTAFTLTISAVDSYNNFTNTYDGPADLTVDKGTVSPVTTGAFGNDGVWNGSITLSNSGNVRLTATDASNPNVLNSILFAVQGGIIVNITSPPNGSSTTNNIETITGTISNFSGTTATMIVNSLKQTITFDTVTGTFSNSAVLSYGINVISVVATEGTETDTSSITITANIAIVDLRVTLTWDGGPTTDVDLHVTEPGGEEIYFAHRTSALGGQLDVDDVQGYGPENITWEVGQATAGTYGVDVHFYSEDQDPPNIDAYITVKVHESTSAETISSYGPHSITTADGSQYILLPRSSRNGSPSWWSPVVDYYYVPVNLHVTKVTDIPDGFAEAGDTNITVMAFNIIETNDTLTIFSVKNSGTMTDTDDVNVVNLWQDVNQNAAYDAGDVLVDTLPFNGSYWISSSLSYVLSGNDSFVLTIDLKGSAITGRTFQAQIPKLLSDATDATPGPVSDVDNSGSITIVVPQLSRFEFGLPTRVTAGQSFTLYISALDNTDKVVSSYDTSLSLSVSTGTITPSTTNNLSNGILVQSNVKFSTAAYNVVLTATDGTVTSTTTLDVNPQVLSSFSVSASVSTITAGQTFDLYLTALDSLGFLKFDYSGTAALSASYGGISQSGVTFSAGLVTVSGMYLTGAETNVVVTATNGSVSGNITILVTYADLDHFDISASVSTVTAGTPFTLTLTPIDKYSNVIGSFSSSVSLSLLENGTIIPSSVSNFSNGVAVNSVSITTTGDSMTFTASYIGKTGSIGIQVTPDILSQFLISANVSSVSAGTAFELKITAADQYKNTYTNYSGTAAITSNTGTITPASTSLTAGTVTLSSVSLTVPGIVTITAQNGSISGTTSVTVTYADLASFNVSASTTVVTSGEVFTLYITAYDAAGNIKKDYTGTPSLSSSVGTIEHTTTGGFINGSKTVTWVAIFGVGTDIELKVTDGSVSAVILFTVLSADVFSDISQISLTYTKSGNDLVVTAVLQNKAGKNLMLAPSPSLVLNPITTIPTDGTTLYYALSDTFNNSGIATVTIQNPRLPVYFSASVSDNSNMTSFTNLSIAENKRTVSLPDFSSIIIPDLAILGDSDYVKNATVTIDINSSDIVITTNNVIRQDPLFSILDASLRNFTVLTDINGDGNKEEITEFDPAVTIIIPWDDPDNDGIVDGTSIREETLRLYHLNEQTLVWEYMRDASFNYSLNYATSETNKLSNFQLVGLTGGNNIKEVRSFPNPFNPNTTALLQIDTYTDNHTSLKIKIYNLSGDLVKTLEGNDVNLTNGTAFWDGRNNAGYSVSSGMYIYTVESNYGNATGKITLVR